jgi:2',3'-cyclic-nucleotide 2'-phosphodiesterase (5'-nucleotidase family)
MPTRRLDDRIREICAQISAVGRDPHSTDQEVEILLQKLQEAIHQKVQRVRIIASNKLLQGNDADKQDRRTRMDEPLGP